MKTPLPFLIQCFILVLLCTGCGSGGEDVRLVDVAPADAMAILSIPDWQGFEADLRRSRFWSLVDDPDFSMLTHDFQAFARRGLEMILAEDELHVFRNMAQRLKIDLADVLTGEATLVALKPSPDDPLLIPDLVLAVDLHPKFAAFLDDPQALNQFFEVNQHEKNFTQEAEELEDGGTLHLARIPKNKDVDFTPAWTVRGNRLLVSPRPEPLKAMLKRLARGPEEDAFLRSKTASAIREALGGEPNLLLSFDMVSLLPVLALSLDPAVNSLLAGLSNAESSAISMAMGVDDQGLVKETFFFSGPAIPTSQALERESEVEPPNGCLAWFLARSDPRNYSEKILPILSTFLGREGALLLMELRDVEEDHEFSLVEDILPVFEGTLAGFAVMPFGARGYPSHFLPDLILKAKINDQDEARKLLKRVEDFFEDQYTQMQPLRLDGLEGLSLRRSYNRFDDIEPTLVIDGEWLVFSLFSPQGILRARQNDRVGPEPLDLGDANLDGLMGRETGFVFLADLGPLLQFGYNLVDFIQHTEREHPVLDYAHLPTEAQLAPYLGPLAMIGNRVDGAVQVTLSSPCGVLAGLAFSANLSLWLEERADRLRSESREEWEAREQ